MFGAPYNEKDSHVPMMVSAVRRAAVMLGALMLAGCGQTGSVGPEPVPTTTIGLYPELAAHDPAAIVARRVPTRLTLVAAPAAGVSDEAAARVAYAAVTQFFDSQYARLPHPAPLRYVPAGRTVPLPGVCGQGGGPQRLPTADGMFYCPVDDTVYASEAAVHDVRRRVGALGLVVSLAHEFTHHMQHVAGMPAWVRYFVQRIPQELQADCGAGAASRSGLLRGVDWRKADALGFWSGNYVHGSGEERRDAFRSGRSDGLWACNALSLPIIVHR